MAVYAQAAWGNSQQKQKKLQKIAKIFAYIKKKHYLCTVFLSFLTSFPI